MFKLAAARGGSDGVHCGPEGISIGPSALVVKLGGSYRRRAAGEIAALLAAAYGPEIGIARVLSGLDVAAAALQDGDLALAMIAAVQLRLGAIPESCVARLAAAEALRKANFNPEQPRVPKGSPDGGEWTQEPGYAKPRAGRDRAGPSPSGRRPQAGARAGAANDRGPPLEYAIEIPRQRPASAQERNRIVRRAAEWLRQAAALGAAFAPDERVKAVLETIEATAWIVEYWPEIRSYLDAPKGLRELEDAVAHPQPGYQVHHIVEGQYDSSDADSNARRFGNRLEQPDNLVLIPKWKHVEISTWYSSANKNYRGLSPRAYLRDKSWEEQYEIGLQALREVGVLK